MEKDKKLEGVVETTALLVNEDGSDAGSIDPVLIERGHARRMGHLENYFALLQRQDLYSNFSIYGQFNRSIDVRSKAFLAALKDIFCKNPILVHTIVPKRYPYEEEYYRSEEYLNEPFPEHDYIKVLPRLSLESVILNFQETQQQVVSEIIAQYRRDDYQVKNVLTELVSQIRIPICDPGKPNWGLICLPMKVDDEKKEEGVRFGKVIYVSNHCCADAMTGINLFQDIIANLNRATDESVSDDTTIFDYSVDHSAISKIPIPITDRIDYRPALSSLPKFMVSTMLKKYFDYRSNAPETKRISEQNANWHSIVNFPSEQMDVIRTAVRTQGCSVTAFLQTCLSVALQNSGVFQNRRYSELGFDISVPSDTRRILPGDLAADQYKYGSNVAGLHYSYFIPSFQETEFWPLTQYYTGVLRGADYLIGLGTIMLDFVYKKQNIDKLISESYLGNRRGGIILSNVGALVTGGAEATKADRWTLRDLKFVQDVGVLNFSYVVNVVSTPAGGMNVCLSCAQGSLPSRAQFDAVCAEFQHLVSRQTQTQTQPQ
ncbi:alcohol O-acetyltransferase KNAG_0H02650 [Huiozyma naganishii CBS 8797]|uniref:Alcohol acetyltransferase n=1 Tax=Huiozyma naganishii (strain ATCC MYA-139 / BCRC 22969 / CBS 8797 / KCTC 17520 / NBRC 10181 / NCYC 3082 / Yp74L-3) TaxID=1071383 RepID=J7R9X6_HUIN7|nr:hypothetical protein KNAG_0H02650 [Kazachstania naganishii CBS 8797]CCK71680.1 hypothetical protein KNAG_0H02650 [Kazachstania naganishii CBS 8797]